MQLPSDGTAVPAPVAPIGGLRTLRVGIVGGQSRAESLLRMLDGVEGVAVCALLAEDAGGVATHLADSIGVFATCDPAVFARRGGFDLVVDAREIGESGTLEPLLPDVVGSAELAGSNTCELLHDLLEKNVRDDELRTLLRELNDAADRSRSQERRLQASTAALESASSDLQSQLSELYFMHEFFKALARYSAVEDVLSLIVDGVNGVFGSEISAVYLCNCVDWTMSLAASQGRAAEVFTQVVPVSETILGAAFSDGFAQEADVDPYGPSAAWIDPAVGVRSQAAVALRAGDAVVGVLVLGAPMSRELQPAETERLITLASQSSLSVQNALLLAELERLSVTDRLTQLYNHAYFHQRLDEEINRSGRYSHPIALMMIDVDDFKTFNDQHGHPRGDDALRALSASIRANLRDMDVAARYGGDEFVVLLPETTLDGAHLVADRIRCEVATQGILTAEPGQEASFTVSTGIAVYPDNAGTAARLVEAADRALYNAKRAGKNRVEP